MTPSSAPKQVNAKVKFTPMQSKEVASRVSILNPESPEQVQAIISAPDGGVIVTLQKETLDALTHFKHFSGVGKLHVWVETLPANESSNKAFKHKHEYRTVVPGKEAEQVKDLLSKLPEMAARINKSISRSPRVRFGFAFWVNLGEKFAVEVTEGIELKESTGDILKSLHSPSLTDELSTEPTN